LGEKRLNVWSLTSRDKIAALSSPALEGEFAAQAAAAGSASSPDAMRDDAISALVNLGYQRAAAEKAVKTAIDEGGDVSVELILRRSLRRLARV
jgi:Holliday junction DNA helicase RuvA